MMVGQIRQDAELQQVHSRSDNYNERYMFGFEQLWAQSQHTDRTYIIKLLVRNETKFGLPVSGVETCHSSLLDVAVSSERHHRLPLVQCLNQAASNRMHLNRMHRLHPKYEMPGS